jgi:hypothetical protein
MLNMSKYLERTPRWAQYPLSPFDESLFISNDISNLDHIAGDIIVQNLDCLLIGVYNTIRVLEKEKEDAGER